MWTRISTLRRRRAAAHKCVGGAAALMIGLTTAAADDKFSLARAIPDDVFITAVQQHNPEREFLHKYWDEVWQAFNESGIIDDVLELALSKLDDEQRTEVTRIKDRFTDLIAAGDWKAMVSGQTAFGERMPGLEERGGNVKVAQIVGAPDFVVMFRTTDAVAQKNFKVLSGLLIAAIEEINAAANIELKVERTVRHEADLVTFNLTQKAPSAPPMPLSIGRRGDTILLTFGQGIRDEVVDLLAGKSAGKSIADTPRFKQAFAQLGPAEDAITFFDMSNLRRGLESIADGIFKAIESEIDDDITNARENEEANELKNEGIAAYEKGDHDKALELTREAYEIAPNDSVIIYNLACLHALKGNRAEALSWLEKAVEAGFHAPKKIAGDADLDSLRNDSRYQAALKSAEQRAGGEKRMKAKTIHGIADRLLQTLGVMEYSATVERTDGFATYTDTIMVLAPDAEQNPIYPVFGNRKPIKDFAAYLPRETVAFSANNGISLDALYGFIEQTFNEAGEPGKQAWQAWQDLQTQIEFDIHTDLLDWLDSDTVNASFQIDGSDQWIFMLKVKDEDTARQKLAAALDFVPKKLAELSAQMPMLAMMAIRTQPTDNEKLEGFHDVSVGFMPMPAVCGVRDGWLMLGSSEKAVLLSLATAAGEHANVRENERLMAELLTPDGPVNMISFTDHRGTAKEIAQVLTALSMAGGFVGMVVPDPQAQKAIIKVFGIISKLAPVAAKVDFYKSSASYVQSDGLVWRSYGVTNYVSPQERSRNKSEAMESESEMEPR